MDSKKREERPLNDAAKQILEGFLKEKGNKSLAFRNAEIEPFILGLKQVEGFERTVGGIRMHLIRMSRRVSTEGTDVLRKKMERCLRGLLRCAETELGVFRKEFREKLAQAKKATAVTKRENDLLKKQITELKKELRELKEVQAAVEKYQSRRTTI